MWTYNYPNELYHYGVLGMKLGHRKARPTTSVDTARSNYKSAKKTYNKSFNKAYNRAIAAYSPSKKHREANKSRWEQVSKDAESLRNAKRAYKAEKKQFKQDVKNVRTSKAELKYDIYNKGNGQVEFKNPTIGGRKVDAAYAKKVGDTMAKQVHRNTMFKQLAGTAAVVTGAAIVSKYLR